jgi:uncharacterized protein (TIGR01440 family)
MMQEIKQQAQTAARELLDAARLRPGDVFVVGCSSSEVVGARIGKGSSQEAAEAILAGVAAVLEPAGIYLAAQCCEHLNRALIVERACAEKYGWDIVSVLPQPNAGGSFATAAYAGMKEPVAVEHIRAHAGMDVGGTLIGMHLRDVAVPVRLSLDHIGEAILLCARTRPKFIGGARAQYSADEIR